MTALAKRHPDRRAEELTGRDYISYSAISTFQACPLKWHFRYVRRLPEDAVSASLVFGGAIHRAAEFHFRELLSGHPPPDLDTLLAEYQDEWDERDWGTVQFGKGDDVDTHRELARRVLGTFQASAFAQPTGRILGVEKKLRGRIADACPELLARVDLIVEDGDCVTVTDLKTSRSRWSQQQVENSADQLILYAELAKQLVIDKPLKLQFAVVTKTKTPCMDVHTVSIDSRRIERTRRVVQHVWDAIQTGYVYPVPSPMNCGGCPYREPCAAWSG